MIVAVRRLLASLLVAGTATLVLPAPASAADAGGLIQTMTTEIIEVARTKTGDDRQAAMRRIVRDNFDIPYVGRLALGMYWDRASEQQKARFLDAVEASEARTYSERLGRHAGYSVIIGTVRSRPDKAWVVESRLNQAGGLPLKIDWEVHESDHGLRVSDVRVEGISMSMILRSEFSAYILGRSGEVESLVRELEARAR
jgi:phospholipid transport system substrate-binding protein